MNQRPAGTQLLRRTPTELAKLSVTNAVLFYLQDCAKHRQD